MAPGAGRPVPLPDAAPCLEGNPRILVLRPDHLGDVLFSGPAIARLRERWPEAHVTFVVGPWGREVAERLPGVDVVRTIEFPWFDRRPKAWPWSPYTRLVRAARDVRGMPGAPFDAALLLRDDDYWGAWLLARAGIPIRAGHDEPGPRPFLTHVLPARAGPAHVASAGIRLVTAFAGQDDGTPDPERAPLRLAVTDQDRRRAAELLDSIGRPGEAPPAARWRPVAVHPGSGAPIKRWRSGGWRQVVDALVDPHEAVLLTGSEAERPLVRATAAAMSRTVLDLCGLTDIGTLAALYERCRIVMGPDSGPLHLAVAVAVPTVHLFGPADARRFGPWGSAARHAVVEARLPCAPCGRLDWPRVPDHPCVRVIEADAVIAAARAVVCDRT